MTTLKLDSKIGGGPAAAIEEHVPALYNRPGCRVLAIVELAHVERTQPAPDSDGEPTVKMRISALEVAGPSQDGVLREALRALYLQRTASGTVSEEGDIELARETLKLTGGRLAELELARLRAGLRHWAIYAHRATTTHLMTATEALHELKQVADGLHAVLDRAGDGS